jgi:lysozyme
MNIQRLIKSIQDHEGFEAFPYKCTAGKWTVGYGHRIKDVDLFNKQYPDGWTKGQATERIKTHIDNIRTDSRLQSVYDCLNDIRSEIITEMCYQLGMSGFLGFSKMIFWIKQGEWDAAADEGLDSKWAIKDTPGRALELMELFRKG